MISEFILLMFFIALFIPLFKTAKFKGKSGEFLVNLSSNIFLEKNIYHFIHNVTLSTDNGTTQIDHIIVSKYGVFVVETKNMKGWIFGDAYQRIWTQKIYKHTNKFQNPLHQNRRHVQVLQSFLQLDDNQIFSIVVFAGEGKFKTEMPENVTDPRGYIRLVKSKQQDVLNEYEVKDIINKIASHRLTPSFKTDREHVKHVKKIRDTHKNGAVCPRCGSSMVIKEAKRGSNSGKNFLGCSRFPKCKGTANI